MEIENSVSRHQFQLIEDDGKINSRTREEVERLRIQAGESSKDYFSIAIIGSQSSGKSTLLNKLFGTSFKVMSKKEASQTTKGVWVSSDNQRKIILYDIEGSDSSERKENDENFEYKLALFGLAAADLFIVNIADPKSISRNSGFAIYSLTRILEAVMEIFPQNNRIKKRILFVVRDSIKKWNFEKKEPPFEVKKGKLKDNKVIEESMERIWNDIELKNKPKSFKDVVNISYYHMSKFKVNPKTNRDKKYVEMFEQQVEILRNKIQKEEGNLRQGHDPENNFTIRSLGANLQIIWQKVQNNDTVNLASYREMADIELCRRARIKILEGEELQEKISNLKDIATYTETESIKEQSEHIWNFVKNTFIERTSRYRSRARESQLEELLNIVELKLIKISKKFAEKIFEGKLIEIKNSISTFIEEIYNPIEFKLMVEGTLTAKGEEYNLILKQRTAFCFLPSTLEKDFSEEIKLSFEKKFEVYGRWWKKYIERRKEELIDGIKKQIYSEFKSIDQIKNFIGIIDLQFEKFEEEMNKCKAMMNETQDENIRKSNLSNLDEFNHQIYMCLENFVHSHVCYSALVEIYFEENSLEWAREEVEDTLKEELISNFDDQNLDQICEEIVATIQTREWENIQDILNELKNRENRKRLKVITQGMIEDVKCAIFGGQLKKRIKKKVHLFLRKKKLEEKSPNLEKDGEIIKNKMIEIEREIENEKRVKAELEKDVNDLKKEQEKKRKEQEVKENKNPLLNEIIENAGEIFNLFGPHVKSKKHKKYFRMGQFVCDAIQSKPSCVNHYKKSDWEFKKSSKKKKRSQKKNTEESHKKLILDCVNFFSGKEEQNNDKDRSFNKKKKEENEE